MKNFYRLKKFTAVSLCTLGANFIFSEAPKAEAVYEARSDTGTELFNYIENRRREERANALTEEQKKLLKDIETAKNNLPKPIQEGEPVPVAFEGSSLSFDAATGEFSAAGKVDIIQLEGYRFQSREAAGNINEQEIRVHGKAHMLQLVEGAPRVTLDGYDTVYNYGTKTGTMGRARGKAGEYYISGKRFEFYPDHIVVYDATQTKCGAKKPDYHVGAKRMEIWPEQIIRMYDVKFYVGERMVGSRGYFEKKIEEGDNPYFPRLGYDTDHGAYIEDTFEIPVINEHFKGVIHAHIGTKSHIRSNAEFHYDNREFSAKALYGYYYDTNKSWIKKEPGLDLLFRKRIPNLPMSYSIEYEIGDWSARGISSTHQEFEIGLAHDPITLFKKYNLFLSTSYKITKDDVKTSGVGDSTVKGMNYRGVVMREFDDRFAAYLGYEYTKNNSQNSVFDFGLDSYSNKFIAGASYRLTDRDRFVVGLKFDSARRRLEDADYYWYRDLHCSTAIIRWRQKRHKWEVRWQFTPW